MASKIKESTLSSQKVKTYMNLLQEDENFWNALLVFLGALFILSGIPFFPLYIIPIMAILCGATAYFKKPYVGTLLSILLAFLAMLYQSPVLGLVFLLVIAITLFEMFKRWAIISALQILIFAPFAPYPLSLISGFVMLGMVLAALHFGSKKSIFISIPAVLMVLLLSSLWLQPTSSFFYLDLEKYEPAVDVLQISKPVATLSSLPSELISLTNQLFNFGAFSHFNAALGKIGNNLFTLLFSDSGLIQMFFWATTLFVISFLSGRIKKFNQIISSLFLLVMPMSYYFLSQSFRYPFEITMFGYAIISIGIIGLLEYLNISFSKESEIIKKDKVKTFGKFGLKDMSFGKGAKSLDDIGGYDDVKDELKNSILMPIEKKEIAYTYGLKPPSGILLFGPPGTGKTMLMRAFANEIGYPIYYVKSSDILSQWHGESLPFNEELIVKTKEGKIKREKIGKIVEEKQKLDVLSFDSYGNAQFSKIKDYIKHKCTSPIYEVRTRTGRKIKVTDYHSLFTLKGCKIEAVPTSQLTPGVSYIAIPHKIEFSENPTEEIDFLGALRKNDRGLFVKNIEPLVRKSLEKIGEKSFRNILGFGKRKNLSKIIKKDMKIRASLFLRLIDEAKLSYRNSNISVCARKKSIPAIIKVDEDFSTFLGLWVAEGSYNYSYSVRLSTSEGEIRKISKLCRKLFGDILVYQKGNGKGRDIYISSKLVYVLLHDILGLEHGGKKKKIPEIAFSLSRANLAALLRGYFSGDGTINDTFKRNVAMVEANTVSDKLANDLLYLLLYFGIVAQVCYRKERTGSISKRIYFYGYESLNKFKEIGFFDDRRMEKLNVYLGSVKWFRSEQVPITCELRDRIRGLSSKWSSSATVGKDKLLGLEWGAEEPEFLESIRNDIYLDRVEEIKKVEDEEHVYDISVDPCQNFVAGFGGIFAHNSEKNVSELFSVARKNAPCILFFDEIDSLGKKRTDYGADDIGPRILSVFLQEMDGFKSGKPVMVVGATNVPQKLDPALMRPGRFDKVIYMHLPETEGRKAIFKVHLGKKNVPVSPDVNYDGLAKKSNRFSGADIKNVVTESLGLAAKQAQKTGKIVPVSQTMLLRVLKSVKPSTSLANLDRYEQFRLDFERRVGKEEPHKKKEGEIITWDDVAGLGNVKQALLEAIELPLLHEELVKEFKIKPSKGILLFGPPGTGKTLIAKAASNELEASFIPLSGAELMKRGYSHALTVLRETFDRARENKPSIIFIDEIETIAPSRDIAPSDIVGQLLTEMDGMKTQSGVVVVSATNKPSILDPAILRPGRFDKLFYVSPPDSEARAQIFKIHLGRFGQGLNLKSFARETQDFTGADIASICQEVKMRLLREKLTGKVPKPSTEMVLRIIHTRRPSVNDRLLQEYEKFLKVYGERK